VTRRQTILGITLFAAVCLGLGVLWTVRTQPPNAHPWWAGKNPKLRAEVWEPGKDMATVAMTMNKKTIDTLVALGVKATVSVGAYSVDLRHHWREIQALPPGERLTLDQDGAKIYVWIETSDVKLPPIVPAAAAESTGT
jgi:hypothetical protein